MQTIKEIILEEQDKFISKIDKSKFEFYDMINKKVQESKEREINATNEPDKEFHRGVGIGMTHVLILLGKIW